MAKIKLHDILSSIILLWVLNPKANLFFSPVILLGIFILWIFCAFSFNKGLTKKELRLVAICCLYPLIIFLYFLIGHSSFEKTPLFIPLISIIYFYYKRHNNSFFRKNIITIFISYFSLIYIYSLIKLQANPNLARLVAGADLSQATLLLGGYNTVYCSVLIDLVIIWKLRYNQKKNNDKIKLFCFLVLSFLFLLKAQYTIAFLLLVIGVVLIVILNQEKKYLFLSSFFIIVIFLVIFLIGFDTVFYKIASFIPQGIMHNRFIQLGDLFSSNRILESNGFDNRMKLYNMSLKTFRHNIFLGIGNYDRDIAFNLIGNHSTYIDSLARYGLLGGGVFIIGRLFYFDKVNNSYGDKEKMILYCVQIIFYIFSVINISHTKDFMFVMMVLIPIFVSEGQGIIQSNVHS